MKTIFSTMLTAALFLSASPASAYDPAHLAQLKEMNKCPKCDLRGADLYEAILRGANLSDADLRAAYLWGARLEGANLRGADLRGANLRYAKLMGADLRFADLRDAKLGIPNKLDRAKLNGAKFCKTKMPDGGVRNDHCEK
jgi:uncharacterized protein YjbI with pentapeptide repeats